MLNQVNYFENKTYSNGNENQPGILYHGSTKLFFEFDKMKSYGSKRVSAIGAFWFTSNKKVALSYGRNLYNVLINFKKTYIVDAKGENYSEIYLTSLPKKMALEIDRLDNRRPGSTYNHLNYNKKEDPDFSLRFNSAELAMAAMFAGFDSICLRCR